MAGNQPVPPPAPNKQYTVILVGEDGKSYMINQDKWQIEAFKLPENDPIQVPIVQAKTFGTYLADIPNLGLGIGGVCIFVNVKGLVEKT